jgi:sodium transport system permease protein
LNWRIIGTVLAKELRETLRDRRTLFIMIVVPVLLYPGMMVMLEQITMFGQRSMEATEMRVAVVGEGTAVRAFLERDGTIRLIEADTVPHASLESGLVDALLVLPEDGWQTDGTNEVGIVYDAVQDRSARALDVVRSRLGEWSDSLVVVRLERQGLPGEYARPIAVSTTSIASSQQMGGYLLGRFLPLMLILMTVLGAFYPSIDMAAGEKERGTLETLLTAPVPPDQVVIGKFVAAGLMGFIAATLNLASMLLTFQSGLLTFGGALDLQFSIPFRAIVVILGVLLLLSVLFSALFLGIAVRSQSFKEAQNALTPVYLLSILPALLAMMPGIGFTPAMALVPVGGVAFLFRDLMGGTVELESAALAVSSTVLYAMIALVYASRAFGREDVLFGGGGGGDVNTSPLRARFGRWRRSPPSLPTVGEAAMVVTLIGLLYFYMARPLMMRLGEQGIWMSQLLLLALPALVYATVARKDVRATFALRRAPPGAFGAALLIILGAIPLGWLLVWLQSFVLELPVEYLQAMEQLVTAGGPGRLFWLLLVLAITPAVVEELVFRGVLLQGLGGSLPMWRSVAVSALVFGAFHLSFETAIRFLPTAFLGLLLGYVVWRTRSIFPGMLMHLVNNATVVVLVSFPALGTRLVDPSGQPPWLVVAFAPFVLWAGLRLLPRAGPGEAGTPGSDEEGVRELAPARHGRGGGLREAVDPASP